MTTRYVALLRGINVGGNNLIKMAELASSFEALGHRRVVTYINSGNVVFDAKSRAAARVTAALQAALAKRFGYGAPLTLRSREQLERIVGERPRGFGSDLEKFRCDVVFLIPPLTPAEVVAAAQPREGVDRIWAGDGVVYFSRLDARASQSRLTKLISLPIYQQMTIRNWNTTTKLLQLMRG